MAADEVRRLVRRTDAKIVAGVAGGLGDYFAVDPIWFRLGFVLAAFLGGSGILAYGVLWLLMPKTGTGQNSLQRRTERLASSLRGTPSWIGVALVVIGGLLVVTQWAHWSASVFWGVALIVLGVAAFNRHEARAQETAVVVEAPAVEPPSEQPLDAAVATVPIEQPLPRPKRARSGLGLITLGAVMLVVGAAALLDIENTVHITLVQYLALALAVLGAGLLTGAFIGRARWLVAPAILLTPFVLAASLIHVPFAGGEGDVSYRPTTVAEIRHEYHISAGRLLIDLRGVKLGTTPVAIRATDVAGRIVVYIPAGSTIQIRGRVGAGEVKLFGRTYDGFNVDVRRSFPSAIKDAPVVSLDLETSLGQVEVLS